jgi:hypothetical protein
VNEPTQEFEDMIVATCKAMQAKGVRITRRTSIDYAPEGMVQCCCALVAASPPASYEAWLAEPGASHGRAGERLGMSESQIADFVVGFDDVPRHHAGPWVDLGKRVAERVLGGLS